MEAIPREEPEPAVYDNLPTELTSEEVIREARRQAYMAADGADAIYMKWQRGEATEQDWLDKVQEIRERYPYPEKEEGAQDVKPKADKA